MLGRLLCMTGVALALLVPSTGVALAADKPTTCDAAIADQVRLDASVKTAESAATGLILTLDELLRRQALPSGDTANADAITKIQAVLNARAELAAAVKLRADLCHNRPVPTRIPRVDLHSCAELKSDQDHARTELADARTALNDKVRQGRDPNSPDGRNLTADEVSQIRAAAHVVDDKQRVFDRIVDRRKRVCNDNGGDTNITVTVVPLPPEATTTTVTTTAPAPVTSQVSEVPAGSVNTGGFEPADDAGFAGWRLAVGVAGFAAFLVGGAALVRYVRSLKA